MSQSATEEPASLVEEGSLDEVKDPPNRSTTLRRGISTTGYSPVRLAFMLAVIIFASEIVGTLFTLTLPPMPSLIGAAIDAALSLLLTAPAIFFLLLIPMRQQIRERNEVALRLEEARDQLEKRVRDRTKQLTEASQEVNRSLQALERTHKEHLVLAELIELLQACRSDEEAERMLKCFGEKLFPAECGAIYVYRASRNVLEIVVSWGNQPQLIQLFAPEDCWALRRGRLHLVEHDGRSPSCRHLGHLEASKTSVCIPMMAQGEATGILVLYSGSSAGSTTDMSEDTRRLAPLAAEQIALALANLQLREKLRDQAIRDPLTGMFNRRYFVETADRDLQRAEQQSSCAGVMMIDIDHFKRFNDTHGHEAGDAVLKKVGLFLQSRARIEDIACRYGGEEFVLLLSNVQQETVAARAEQIREGIKELDVRFRGETLQTLTISCGVALFPIHGHNCSELTEVADRALYRAKQEGRDRVIVAS